MATVRTNKEIGKQLADLRKSKGFTQESIAAKIAEVLGRESFSKRQYQKMEDGLFPQFKSTALGAVDKVLGTDYVKQVYEQEVPRGTESSHKAEIKPSNTDTIEAFARSMVQLSESILIDAKNRDRLISMLEQRSNSVGAGQSEEIHAAKIFALEEYVLQLGQELRKTDRKSESVILGKLEGVGYRLGEGTYTPPSESEDTQHKSKSTLKDGQG